MRDLYQVVKEMNIYTKEGVKIINEAYEVVRRIDKELSKDDITIITNFADEFPYEFQEMMREKEREMHGLQI
ncbi:hypothetical protein RVS70_05385 [Virgibacillus sp. M23]|uniref:hypothetical protein n=1 Tax=Virgibacillus sp. M23 TaxID=3079030 RepID=UPI002A90D257|nr:hypothetical protein [Virgibacillus sp. M23]MDY7043634.1 hypothetical protein [Virgibacillus sp. M23]